MPKSNVEVLVEVWRVTEIKDDCISGTEYVEDRWVPVENASGRIGWGVGCLFYTPKSTEFNSQMIRMVRTTA